MLTFSAKDLTSLKSESASRCGVFVFAGGEEMVPSNSNERSNDSSVLPVEDGDAGRWPHVMSAESELAGGDAG